MIDPKRLAELQKVLNDEMYNLAGPPDKPLPEYTSPIQLAATLEDAKRDARPTLEQGAHVQVVRVGELVGWSHVPSWGNREDVGLAIAKRLCQLQSLPFDGKMVPVDVLWRGMSDTEH